MKAIDLGLLALCLLVGVYVWWLTGVLLAACVVINAGRPDA